MLRMWLKDAYLNLGIDHRRVATVPSSGATGQAKDAETELILLLFSVEKNGKQITTSRAQYRFFIQKHVLLCTEIILTVITL